MSNDPIASDKKMENLSAPIRKRGKSFPVVSLSEAAQILREAGKYGFEHPIASFATYMGHKTITSGAFRQRLAGFREWGLITGRGEVLGMTEIARKIAMPPDEVTEREALRQAFGNCEAFAELHDQMAKDQPLDHVRIGNQAVHGFGVAPNRARLFARSFAESAIAAQLAKADGEGRLVLLAADNDEQTEDGDQPHEEPITTETGDARPAQTGHRIDREPSSALSPTIRQSWPIAGGEIVLEVRSQEALPATVFVVIGEVVTKLEELSSSLRRPDGSETDDGGGET